MDENCNARLYGIILVNKSVRRHPLQCNCSCCFKTYVRRKRNQMVGFHDLIIGVSAVLQSKIGNPIAWPYV